MIEKKGKKIAVCFSGQARTLDKCFEYIKLNVLDQLGKPGIDYDVFCCTEDDKDAKIIEEKLAPTLISKIKSCDVEKIIEKKYGKLLEQNYKDFIYPGTPRFNLKIFLQQFYKGKIVNELRKEYEKQNNISYYKIIRLRFDVLCIDRISISIVNDSAHGIYIPYDILKKDDEINDMFAIGDSRSMDIYYSMFDDFEEIIKQFKITPSIGLKYLFHIEKLYVLMYGGIISLMTKLRLPKVLIDNLFKVFGIIQWSFLRKYKDENAVYQEKMLYRTLLKNGVTINKIKFNLFLVRENRFLNIFISKD